MSTPEDRSSQIDAFADRGKGKRPSFFSEFLFFLRSSRKWWMLPLILLLLAFGLLMVLSSSGIAPFIYTVF